MPRIVFRPPTLPPPQIVVPVPEFWRYFSVSHAIIVGFGNPSSFRPQGRQEWLKLALMVVPSVSLEGIHRARQEFPREGRGRRRSLGPINAVEHLGDHYTPGIQSCRRRPAAD